MAEATSLKTLAKKRTDIAWIDLDDTEEIPNWNARHQTKDYLAHIERLAELIETQGGIENPLRGYFDKATGKFKLTRGYSRRAALKLLAEKGLTFQVPVLGERVTDPVDMIAVQLRDNGGRPLTALETAELFKRLFEGGWSSTRIAKEHPVKISRQHVENLIALADAPEKVKQMVMRGEVSATTAAQEMKAANGDTKVAEEVLTTLVKEAKEQGVKPTSENAKTVRQVVQHDEPKARTATEGSVMDKAEKPAKKKPELKKGKVAKNSGGYDNETVEKALALLNIMRQALPDATVEVGSVNTVVRFKAHDWFQIEGLLE